MADNRTPRTRKIGRREQTPEEVQSKVEEIKESARREVQRAPTTRELTRPGGAASRMLTQRGLGKVEVPTATPPTKPEGEAQTLTLDASTDVDTKPKGLGKMRGLRGKDGEAQGVPTTLQAEISVYAIKYVMGQRYYYSGVLPLTDVATMLPRPDPLHPFPGNRRVDPKHANGFSLYIRENPMWTAPGLVLRGPDVFDWEPLTEPVNGVSLGILKLPKGARLQIGILDGQHRILGIDLALEQIGQGLSDTASKISQANAAGREADVTKFNEQYQNFKEEEERLLSEQIDFKIMVEVDDVAYMQAFADIAENAKGINKSTRLGFDRRMAAARVLDRVLQEGHELLTDHVDRENDRTAGQNPNWLSAKQLADVITVLEVGNNGKIDEDAVSQDAAGEKMEQHLAEQTIAFFDILNEAFPVIANNLNGEGENQSAPHLRATDLLGSATTVRVLAGVYHRLSESMSDEEIADWMIKDLQDTTTAPITADHPWIDLPGIKVGARSPEARRQDIDALIKALAEIALGGEQPDEGEVSEHIEGAA